MDESERVQGGVPFVRDPLPHEPPSLHAHAYKPHAQPLSSAVTSPLVSMNERVRTVEDLQALQRHAIQAAKQHYDHQSGGAGAVFPTRFSEKEMNSAGVHDLSPSVPLTDPYAMRGDEANPNRQNIHNAFLGKFQILYLTCAKYVLWYLRQLFTVRPIHQLIFICILDQKSI